MPNIEIGDWQILPSEGGTRVVFGSEYMAVSGRSRLCVWRGKSRVITLDARYPSPGLPRFVGAAVHWGPAMIDLNSGTHTWIEAAIPAVLPSDVDVPHVYEWSPNGDWLLGGFSLHRSHAVLVQLFQASTGKTIKLWEGSGLAPEAAWLGDSAIVVESENPRVFDYSGNRRAEIVLHGGTLPAMSAARDERRLLITLLNRSLAWIDTTTWTTLDYWPGPWFYGAVSPDARFAVALEFGGKLQFAALKADRFEPVGMASAHDGAISLAVSSNAIATVGAGEVRWARLQVDVGARSA
jgi:hypothetical protein